MMIESTYHLKWVSWNSGMIPIVMQSANGPCPLIATMNVLLLREKVKLPEMLEQITEAQLLAYIGESIMDSVQPANMQNDENFLLNLEQNIHDAIEILPKLKTGLDVNIRFTGITDFEYTPECIIFDLLRIPLYHGWLIDPESSVLQDAIGNQSYNQLVDNIITNKASSDPVISTKVLVAEDFLERTASQLTVHGLSELKSKILDNEIGILFRNNHFLTLFKRDGEIYTLVTDHGYLTEFNIVWETLDSIEGAGVFFDANFQLSELNRRVAFKDEQREKQLANDYLIALSLKEDDTDAAQPEAPDLKRQRELKDLEMAKRLQEEEDRLVDPEELGNLNATGLPSATTAHNQETPDGALSSSWSHYDSSPRLPATSLNSKDTQTGNQQSCLVTTSGWDSPKLDTTKLNPPSLSDHRTFPDITMNPIKDESLKPSDEGASLSHPKEEFANPSLPSYDCVEVVSREDHAADSSQQSANLPDHHQQLSAQHQHFVASPSLTYATVVDPARGREQENPQQSTHHSASPADQQQQRRPSSGRNGNRPRSEKAKESTCRVH